MPHYPVGGASSCVYLFRGSLSIHLQSVPCYTEATLPILSIIIIIIIIIMPASICLSKKREREKEARPFLSIYPIVQNSCSLQSSQHQSLIRQRQCGGASILLRMLGALSDHLITPIDFSIPSISALSLSISSFFSSSRSFILCFFFFHRFYWKSLFDTEYYCMYLHCTYQSSIENVQSVSNLMSS